MLTVKIWDVNPSKSEVIGHYDGNKKMNDRAEPTKSNAKKKVFLSFLKSHLLMTRYVHRVTTCHISSENNVYMGITIC